ncbi:hypothetical protein LTR28_013078 [Elasticomyces elasticus]|nr:hypothetical protein LTR28_013078 [Elasticomyces elasticus]
MYVGMVQFMKPTPIPLRKRPTRNMAIHDAKHRDHLNRTLASQCIEDPEDSPATKTASACVEPIAAHGLVMVFEGQRNGETYEAPMIWPPYALVALKSKYEKKDGRPMTEPIMAELKP